jgi:magnesium chelatase family protein
MAVSIRTASFIGIEGSMITVEVDITRGLPSFNIVGMADISVRESKERVRSAIINSGFDFPVNRITVNLAPADFRKEGSLFDLPIAVGILVATSQIKFPLMDNYLFMGELSLNGKLKKIRGALPLVIEGIKNNINSFILPKDNSLECSVLKDARIYSFESLRDVLSCIEDSLWKRFISYNTIKTQVYTNNIDFSDVIGQESSKRAIEIAAAGNHNMILAGPPGVGKTMLAERIPSILPPMSFEEALDVNKIYSVSGNLDKKKAFISERPFRSPHHTTSYIALVGGGSNPQPGEISLAHNGILFLDEIVEFKSRILEVLREPMEKRSIKISRARGTVTYPANFMLVGALNPCPCGYYGSEKSCSCSEHERKRYVGRLTGPLLDRVDIFTYVKSLSFDAIKVEKKSENSSEIRKRIEGAREIQRVRYKDTGISCNSDMNSSMIKKYCTLTDSTRLLMEQVYNKYHLSARAYNKILKVARTIADLNGSTSIRECEVIEAIQYRRFLNSEII